MIVISLKAARLLAAFALCLQVMLPGVMTIARADDANISGFICVTPGQPASKDARLLGKKLSRKLSDLSKEEQQGDTDKPCPFCVFPVASILPAEAIVWRPTWRLKPGFIIRYKPRLTRQTRGPPVGLRAPPYLD